jgi:hypothetical protein
MQGRARCTEEMTLRETMLRDPEAAPVAADIPRRQGLAFMQLTRRTCRWPIGDPKTGDFCFCGATSVRNGRIASFISGPRQQGAIPTAESSTVP